MSTSRFSTSRSPSPVSSVCALYCSSLKADIEPSNCDWSGNETLDGSDFDTDCVCELRVGTDSPASSGINGCYRCRGRDQEIGGNAQSSASSWRCCHA